MGYAADFEQASTKFKRDVNDLKPGPSEALLVYWRKNEKVKSAAKKMDDAGGHAEKLTAAVEDIKGAVDEYLKPLWAQFDKEKPDAKGKVKPHLEKYDKALDELKSQAVAALEAQPGKSTTGQEVANVALQKWLDKTVAAFEAMRGEHRDDARKVLAETQAKTKTIDTIYETLEKSLATVTGFVRAGDLRKAQGAARAADQLVTRLELGAKDCKANYDKTMAPHFNNRNAKMQGTAEKLGYEFPKEWEPKLNKAAVNANKIFTEAVKLGADALDLCKKNLAKAEAAKDLAAQIKDISEGKNLTIIFLSGVEKANARLAKMTAEVDSEMIMVENNNVQQLQDTLSDVKKAEAAGDTNRVEEYVVGLKVRAGNVVNRLLAIEKMIHGMKNFAQVEEDKVPPDLRQGNIQSGLAKLKSDAASFDGRFSALKSYGQKAVVLATPYLK